MIEPGLSLPPSPDSVLRLTVAPSTKRPPTSKVDPFFKPLQCLRNVS